MISRPKPGSAIAAGEKVCIGEDVTEQVALNSLARSWDV